MIKKKKNPTRFILHCAPLETPQSLIFRRNFFRNSKLTVETESSSHREWSRGAACMTKNHGPGIHVKDKRRIKSYASRLPSYERELCSKYLNVEHIVERDKGGRGEGEALLKEFRGSWIEREEEESEGLEEQAAREKELTGARLKVLIVWRPITLSLSLSLSPPSFLSFFLWE